ncbi:MAG TPA: energy-coupling factor transporter transmembrane component T [Thermomicrobiaceae bacterium]|nr:energy-coupling factor transporter transmembrane component T [Thermomicrobiaceae bacterium]
MSRSNSLAWLIWAGAAALLVISSRNPLLLGLVLLEAALVYLTGDRGGVRGAAWSSVLRIGLAVAGLNIAFNLLTAHVGDHVLLTLPGAIPIAGGPLTLNSLLYGAVSGAAIVTLLLIAACFNARVERAALLRLVPGALLTSGMAAIVALSFFPQTLQALTEVREAQAARGFRLRSPRDLNVLIVPVLHLGLERAFKLAETMESRGFGARAAGEPRSAWLLPAGLLTAISGVTLLVMGARFAGLAVLLAALVLLGAGVTRAPRTRRGSLRPLPWNAANLALLATALAALALEALAIVVAPAALEWSPYPGLSWPALGLLPALASLLLAAPLVLEAVAP